MEANGVTQMSPLDQAQAAMTQAQRRLDDLRAVQQDLIAAIRRLGTAAEAGVVDGTVELSALAKRKAAADADIAQSEAALREKQGIYAQIRATANSRQFEEVIGEGVAARAELIATFRRTCELWGRLCTLIGEATELSNSLGFAARPGAIALVRQLQTLDPFAQQDQSDLWATRDWPGKTLPLPGLRPMVATFNTEEKKQ